MSKYKIEYSRESKQDLIGIKQYIKYNLQETKIAENLINKIIDRIEKLKDEPKIYPIIDEEIIKRLEIRKILIENYIIFYRIKSQTIEIIRIMYGRRNWISLL